MMQELGWIHKFYNGTSDKTLLLLHGTGGDENSLFSLGRELVPDWSLLSVRGRSLEEGFPRFFRRFSATSYDQDHIAQEADALAVFIKDATEYYKLHAKKIVALGFSNGANIGLASVVRNPRSYAGAVLLRPVMPFNAAPQVDLKGFPVLIAHGISDSFLPYGEPIGEYLRKMKAVVQEERINSGHDLTQDDVTLAKTWLKKLDI